MCSSVGFCLVSNTYNICPLSPSTPFVPAGPCGPAAPVAPVAPNHEHTHRNLPDPVHPMPATGRRNLEIEPMVWSIQVLL